MSTQILGLMLGGGVGEVWLDNLWLVHTVRVALKSKHGVRDTPTGAMRHPRVPDGFGSA